MYFNNDYMQNLNYYNQNPFGNMNSMMGVNANNGYLNNNTIGNQTNGLYNNLNPYTCFLNSNTVNNMNNLYPEIYRITYPIVKNLVSSSNINMIDETGLNNMVDTVLRILDGENGNQRSSLNNNSNNNNNNNNNSIQNQTGVSNNLNTSNVSDESSNLRNNNQNTNMNSNNIENNFLRDIIKIIILKEIISRLNRMNLNTFLDTYFI